MKSKDMAISESVFNSLIFGYGKTGDLKSADETLEMIRTSGLEPSAETRGRQGGYSQNTPPWDRKFSKYPPPEFWDFQETPP